MERATVIKSGGTVVKNVTGYDLSKLVSGSFGTLVALTEVTLKISAKKAIPKYNYNLRKRSKINFRFI
jgi:glycolate oxidase FAD binding subunit